MWAVIGVWDIDEDLIDAIRSQVPDMAAGKINLPGFVHGTWTMDGHAVLVFADEPSALQYYEDMLTQGAVDRPGIRSVVWHLSEVGAESDTTGWTARDGTRHAQP
ncbi:hypothetical protein AB0E69_27015 [Kribbella sp. NPDC026611]|uniref:hypothetical protein n=1 Tax=Kribbella sp. NPDC026611 TaxID=3154911 RepID=UPI0033DFF21F